MLLVFGVIGSFGAGTALGIIGGPWVAGSVGDFGAVAGLGLFPRGLHPFFAIKPRGKIKIVHFYIVTFGHLYIVNISPTIIM